MIAIQHRDGRTIEINCPDEDGARLKPALASGWAVGRLVVPTAPQFVALDAAPVVKRERKPREVKAPAPEVERAVREWYAPGKEGSKRAFTDATGMAVDTASAAIDYLLSVGAFEPTKAKGKTYRVKAPGTKAGE